MFQLCAFYLWNLTELKGLTSLCCKCFWFVDFDVRLKVQPVFRPER